MKTSGCLCHLWRKHSMQLLLISPAQKHGLISSVHLCFYERHLILGSGAAQPTSILLHLPGSRQACADYSQYFVNSSNDGQAVKLNSKAVDFSFKPMALLLLLQHSFKCPVFFLHSSRSSEGLMSIVQAFSNIILTPKC